MRFLHLLLVISLMGWTWSLAHNKDSVTELIHEGIQQDLKNILLLAIHENVPLAKSVSFGKFWTEKLSKKKIKASFDYSYTEEDAEGQLSKMSNRGYAILNKSKTQPTETDNDYDPNIEVWHLDELFILDTEYEINKALLITPLTDESNDQ